MTTFSIVIVIVITTFSYITELQGSSCLFSNYSLSRQESFFSETLIDEQYQVFSYLEKRYN